MHLRTIVAGLAALSFSSSLVTAQTAEGGDLFAEILAANTYTLEVTERGASGEGYDFLVNEAREAQFFLIGEAHATADIAWLSRHLFEDLEPAGYEAAAIEVGPWSTEVLEELLRGPRRAYEDYVGDLNTNLAFPFIFFAEELDFARAVVAETNAPALWGLDQEFIGSGMIIADVLEGLAETPAQAAAVAAFRVAAEQNPMHVGTTDPAAFAELEAAFGTDRNSEGYTLVEELFRTNRIYAPFTGRGGFGQVANLEREDQMKLNFLAALAAWEAANGTAPHVMVKLGGNHTAYGRTPTNVPGVGNFIREWGLSRGFSVFNAHMDCLSGEAMDVQGGEAVPCASYRLPENSLLRSSLDGSSAVVIDLRPFRAFAARWDFLDPDTESMIFAYDVYVGIPDVTAAELMGPPLGGQ